MRLSIALVASWAAALLCGCSHSNTRGPIVLGRVGPTGVKSEQTAQGTLLVFSAPEVEMPDNTLSTRRAHYTDYKIMAEDDQLLRTVHNDYDNAWEGPREVELAPGKYRIVAQAAKYGTVTVPVLIAAHQITRVNLTGTPIDGDKEASTDPDVVCLPKGEIVGHFAREETPAPMPLAKDNSK